MYIVIMHKEDHFHTKPIDIATQWAPQEDPANFPLETIKI